MERSRCGRNSDGPTALNCASRGPLPLTSSRTETILWGRLATCGRLAIGLPVARAALDQRLHSLRLAAMWGRLATCGRLAIGLPVARTALDQRLHSLRLAAMYYNSFQYSRAATILYHRKQIAEAMYYNPFLSSRAATILYHRKQIAEAMWGRLATCGRLAIGLPRPARNLPGQRLHSLRLAAMRGAGWQPAADWQSVCWQHLQRRRKPVPCGAGNPACSRLSGGSLGRSQVRLKASRRQD
jgi:hypothetical protein